MAEGRAAAKLIPMGSAFSGGTLVAYAAGTTTPKIIWRDAGKTTAATQPLRADQNGVFQFYGDGDYRIDIGDSVGKVYTIDPMRITDDTSLIWEGSNGTTLPSVNPLGQWHLFAKTDGANGFQGFYLSTGASYVPVTADFAGGLFDPKTYGAVVDGVTDDSAALQAAADAALTAGAGLLIPVGTMLVADTVTINDAVPMYGFGMTSIIKASGFSGTTSIGGKTIDKPVIILDGLASGDTVSRFEGFQIDCDDNGFYGLFIAGGAANVYANIRVNKALKTGIVVDATQNGMFYGCRSTRSQEYNWYVANGAGHNSFTSCHASAADLANVYFNTNTGFPGEGFVSFTEPTQNLWTKGVFERTYLAAGTPRRLHMVTGDRNTFDECNVASAATTAMVDVESGAGSNVFSRLRISAPAPTPIAIRNAGFQNRFTDPNINTSSTMANMIECSGQTIIERPIRSGTAPTKWIANTSGTASDTRICQVTLFADHGLTSQRPTSDVTLMDAVVRYFDADLNEWIRWDYNLTTPDWSRESDQGPAGAVGSDLTIDSGAITVTASYHRVETGTVNFISTTGIPNGYRLTLATDGSGTVFLTDTATSPPTGFAALRLGVAGGATRDLDSSQDNIDLFYNGTNWKERAFADNG